MPAIPDPDVIVIGSGAGGLSAAVALARAGKRVQVFEQHYLPGGWCHSFPLGGFHFSPGVHYIGALDERGFLRRVYEGLGVSEDLVFLELNPDGYDHVQIGDERFDIPRGRDVYADRLKQRFPSEAAGIDRYLDDMHGLAKELMGGLSLRGPRDLPKMALSRTARFGWRPLAKYLDGITKDPLLRAILTIQAGDHGMPPSRCPTAMHAAIVAHYFKGGYYPRGGARSLPRAFLRQLRRHGGAIQLRTAVQRIVVEGGKAVGVMLADGTEVRADVVISNADPQVTFDLVGPEHTPAKVQRRLSRTAWSISGLSLFLGVDMDVRAAGLDSGNVWYSRTPDIEAFYDLVKRPDLHGLDALPGAFLTCTTLKDPSKRKDGKHALEAFCFVGHEPFARWKDSDHEDRPAAYEALKEELTDRMFDVVEEIVPGLRDHTVFHSLGTPLTNRFYVNSTAGNLYGVEKSLRQSGPFGWKTRSAVPGLYMVGASTTGHGVAGATMSGLFAAKDIVGCGVFDLLDPGGPSLRTFPAEAPDTWPAELQPTGEAVA